MESNESLPNVGARQNYSVGKSGVRQSIASENQSKPVFGFRAAGIATVRNELDPMLE